MKNSPQITISMLTLMVASITVGSIDAKAAGFALNRFQPAPAGDRFFGVQGGDPGGHLSPRLMLLGDYAYKPLVLYQGGSDNELGTVVKNQLFLHLAAGVSLWDRLWLSASVPLAVLNNGNQVAGAPAAPTGAAAGDVRAGLRLRILGENRSLGSLAFSGYVYFPTGSRDQFTGSGEVHAMPALVLSGEGEWFAYAVNGGVDLRKKTDNRGTPMADFGSELTFGAAAGVLLMDRLLQVGPELYGSTLMVGRDRFSAEATNLEAILGARMRAGDFVFGAGTGPGITQGAGTPALRILASLAFSPMPPEPAPVKPVRRVVPSDRDRDGIFDGDDACPDEKGVRSKDPAKHGCPPPPADRDGDGIPDKGDACPDVKGVPSDDPTEHGCPPDSDGDGIRDDVDACPREKGKANEDPLKHGCPAAVRVTEREIIILEQVQFKTASAEILPTSDELLRQVSAVLTEHPEIRTLEVQGHTDNRGGKAYNFRLSEKRAASVRQWLVRLGGIDPARLSSHGYGMEEPIADNDTDEGRQKNRRVQFKITEKNSSTNEVTP